MTWALRTPPFYKRWHSFNIRAADRLTGKAQKKFNDYSLRDKWNKFPKLIGLVGFKSDDEPFCSFGRLVKLRNDLVHYKAKREDWIPPGVPTFLLELGLTREEGEKSIKTAKGMIRELSQWLGEGEPFWLRRKDKVSYFEVKFE